SGLPGARGGEPAVSATRGTRSAAGGPLTADERDQAATLLQTSVRQLIEAVNGLPDARWRYAPDATAWSALEIVEHLVRSEQAVAALTRASLARAVPTPPRPSRVRDLAVIMAVTNRDRRFQAIEVVRPTGVFATPAGAVEALTAARRSTVAYIQATGDDLRSRLADHPVLGEIDLYQWHLFLGAHTERHTAQVRDVVRGG
ncbi:MAG: DinB family protein, partial [Vicinamibacterales bacterium]